MLWAPVSLSRCLRELTLQTGANGKAATAGRGMWLFKELYGEHTESRPFALFPRCNPHGHGGIGGGEKGSDHGIHIISGPEFRRLLVLGSHYSPFIQGAGGFEISGPKLHNAVERLAARDKLPMPKLFIIPTQTPNAFATGRDKDHAAVAVTEGILKILNEQELEGVIAHELSHIRNRDILISTTAGYDFGSCSPAGEHGSMGCRFRGCPGQCRWHHRYDRYGDSGSGRSHYRSDGHLKVKEYVADADGARLSGHPQAWRPG